MSLKDTDVKTLGDEAIAKKFKLSLAKVRALVKVGADHEKEHNTNLEKAKQVARDHIAERPDYYKMLKKAERTDKNHMKEELAGTDGVRGLGNVTGDPAVGLNSYTDTNAMSYVDENGNKLEWIKKNTVGHNAVGFKEFDPTELTKTVKQKLKEGISAGQERSTDYMVGDAGGGRSIPRQLDVKEGAKLDKAKKVGMAGLTAANLYTLGDVTSRAVEGNRRVSAKHDIVKAASTLPGPAGYAAAAVNYAKQAYDRVKAKKMQEDKDPCWKGYEMVGMKKKGGRKVPNCVPVEHASPGVTARYTERPTYEGKSMGNDLPKVGGIARGIYQEGWASIGSPYDWAGDVNRKAKFSGNKPKPTTTKNDEKDDIYKGSKQGGKVKFAKTVKEEQIEELKAETLGSYTKKAAASRKKSLEGSNPDIKTWSKRQKGITTAIKKLTTVEDANKPDVDLQAKSYSGASGTTHTIHEDTKMDNKDLINEAIENIIENDLVSMKENLMTALQEKAMEKLEEKKKAIASDYFAQ